MAEAPAALVTFATHFVGGGAVDALAERGFRVAVHDPGFADAAARARFADDHPGVAALDTADAADAVGAAAAALGRLDAVVSNDPYPAERAAIGQGDPAAFQAALEALAVTPYRVAGRAADVLGAAGGALIFVTSAAPLKGLANYSGYAAARGATNALAVSLAVELAPAGIRVNAVAPNFIESPTYFPVDLLADPAARAKILSKVPLGRLGSPLEVGRLIAFLASADGAFITGRVVPVDGGWS